MQEVPSLIPGDITSLFQHLSFLFSFKFWIPKAQIFKITKSRFLYMGQFGVFRTRVLFQPTLLLYRLHWILFWFTLQYSTPKRTLCFINSSLCSRRLKVMGARKNGVGPVLSCYFFLIISKHLLCRLYKQEICEKKAPDFNKSKNKNYYCECADHQLLLMVCTLTPLVCNKWIICLNVPFSLT